MTVMYAWAAASSSAIDSLILSCYAQNQKNDILS